MAAFAAAGIGPVSWLPILLLAAACFVFAAKALALPRSGWALFGMALVVGLAGYAAQGFPGYAGAPANPAIAAPDGSDAMIDARRDFFGSTLGPSYYVTVADAYARKGRFEDATQMLANAVEANPRDAEAWVAMGNALIEHSGGTITPAAVLAFERAEELRPGHPAPAYFAGINLLREGQPREARAVWAALLKDAPADAEWRAAMELRLERLDALLATLPPE
ncbi:MAG: tetratricopeptide repeat protein [Pontixanthobacter sp.]